MPEVDIKPEVNGSLTGTDAGTTTNLQRRINALKNVQLKMVDVEAKFFDELHQLECKYASLYEPFYEQRRKIVAGEYEPSEEEGKWTLSSMNDAVENAINGGVNIDESGKKLLNALKGQLEAKAGKNKETTEKGIPDFWLETLKQFRVTAEIIQEHDEPILSYLYDIKVKFLDKKPLGYTLEFYFGENPYFTDKVLTKTYEYNTEVDPKDPFSFEGLDLNKTVGCSIDWKADKNVTVKMVKKKMKPKNKKAPPKIITKEEKQDSFFNFFETPEYQRGEKPENQVKKIGDEGEDEDDDENVDDMYLMADFEIGQYLREKVIPKATLFYTGELDGMEDEYEDYDDEDDEDEDDEEDDDEDEDDDEEDEEEDENEEGKKANKVNGKGKKGRKGGEPTPSECKQN